MGDREFRALIDRFFQVSAHALVQHGAIVDRLAGDEAIGFFVPGMAGAAFYREALESAKEILRATGQGTQGDPWIPVGVGVHAGNAFVGWVGSPEGVMDFTALGDDVNAGARIASKAGSGEILASLDFCRKAGVEVDELEHHELLLRGKEDTVETVVLPID
jgi:adenylate cyclase